MQDSDPFYRLDNSAILTAAIANTSGPFVFRFSCVFDTTVDAATLTRSMARLAPRFPYLHVSLGRGVFWHYFDPLRKVPLPEAEGPFPAAPIPNRRGRPLFRVLAYGRRIACEFHHAITDGSGAMAYFRALICDYWACKGVGVLPAELDRMGIPRAGVPPDPEESEDAYARYFTRSVPPPDPRPQAFLLPGRRRYEGYRETVGVASVAQVLASARSMKTSLTEFIAAIYLAALQDVYEALPPGPRRRAKKILSIQIPINLRNLYPTKSQRNFTLLASPTLDLRLGHWNFDEILSRVHHELRLGLTTKELVRQLSRNVGGERNILSRSLFLPLKAMALRRINAGLGEKTYSGSVSNLGELSLPKVVAGRVEAFGFLPSRAAATTANMGILSWNGSLVMTIGSLAVGREFERLFFTRLASFGFPLRVSCNEAFKGEAS